MFESISSRWVAQRAPLAPWNRSEEDPASGIPSNFVEMLGPVSLDGLEELKHCYASMIIQLDRLRPKLPGANELARMTVGTWSVCEILGHLIDTDREIWWPRITAILQQVHPRFSHIDHEEFVCKKNWRTYPLEEVFALLMRTRWGFAMKLQEIPRADFEKTGEHPTLGNMSILRILQILVAHDAYYLETICTMIEGKPVLSTAL